jgi:hypothetical protein
MTMQVGCPCVRILQNGGSRTPCDNERVGGDLAVRPTLTEVGLVTVFGLNLYSTALTVE